MTTDNTQELDEIMDKIYDLAYDHLTDRGIAIGTVRIKQAILDWHNKQTLELLDRLEAKLSHFGHDATVNIEAERNKLKEKLNE